MQHFGISSPLVSYCSNVFSSDDSRKHRGVPWWLCTRWWRYPSVILLWLVVKPKYRSCHKISDINFTKCDGHHRTLPAACNMCNIESPKETYSAKCHISSSHFRCCELFMCVFFFIFQPFFKNMTHWQMLIHIHLFWLLYNIPLTFSNNHNDFFVSIMTVKCNLLYFLHFIQFCISPSYIY